MKALLISIRPEWVAKILNGEKTIEIRKTAPKCDLPIDVYIYCTKKDNGLRYWGYHMGGRIFAKFTLKKMEKFIQGLNEAEYEHLPNFALKDYDYYGLENLMEKACLNDEELAKYAPDQSFYAWYISDLQIFDEPKELSEFRHMVKPCGNCDVNWLGIKGRETCAGCEETLAPLEKAPQSWSYVEVEEQ